MLRKQYTNLVINTRNGKLKVGVGTSLHKLNLTLPPKISYKVVITT
jgi:hypothetical protein